MNIFIKCLNCIPRGKIHYCAETFLQIEGSYPVASNTLTMKISYIGHATVIVDGAKCKFITDPLLVKRIFGIGPKRRVALLLDRDALADLDFILISHGHFDHLDKRSLRKLQCDIPVVCSPMLESIVHRSGHKKTIPLKWWQSTEVAGIKITAVPTFHFAIRPPFHYARDFQGYIIEAEQNLFFAGDTGIAPFFKDIGEKFKIDIAFLPIGAYYPDSFRVHHMSPEDALDTLEVMNIGLLVPIHWETFKVSWEPMDEPPKRLAYYAHKKSMENRYRLLKPGESAEL